MYDYWPLLRILLKEYPGLKIVIWPSRNCRMHVVIALFRSDKRLMLLRCLRLYHLGRSFIYIYMTTSISPGYLAGRPHLAVDDAVVAAVPLPLRQVASCNCNTLHVLVGDLSHLQQASHQQQPRHCWFTLLSSPLPEAIRSQPPAAATLHTPRRRRRWSVSILLIRSEPPDHICSSRVSANSGYS